MTFSVEFGHLKPARPRILGVQEEHFLPSLTVPDQYQAPVFQHHPTTDHDFEARRPLGQEGGVPLRNKDARSKRYPSLRNETETRLILISTHMYFMLTICDLLVSIFRNSSLLIETRHCPRAEKMILGASDPSALRKCPNVFVFVSKTSVTEP